MLSREDFQIAVREDRRLSFRSTELSMKIAIVIKS